jgi:hypothetical protein
VVIEDVLIIDNYQKVDTDKIHKYFCSQDKIDWNQFVVVKYPYNLNLKIDYDQLSIELLNCVTSDKYKRVAESDSEAARIIYEHLGKIPVRIIAMPGFILYLSLMNRDYIVKRWGKTKNGIAEMNRDRYSHQSNKTDIRNRNAILRLLYAAREVNGDVNLLNLIYKYQDLSVGVLERNWSFSQNFIAWYVRKTQKKMSELIDPKYHDYMMKNNIYDKVWLDWNKSNQYRQFNRIFRAFACQEIFEIWEEDQLNTCFKNSASFCFEIYFECKKIYEKASGNGKLNFSLTEAQLISYIIRNNTVPDGNLWLEEIDQDIKKKLDKKSKTLQNASD